MTNKNHLSNLNGEYLSLSLSSFL
uniref:Uncharacterized protein n=1 Tax=Lepeophtheirus salmonis TaxID=72036 RepID=A0A0K2VCP1_LEPSM